MKLAFVIIEETVCFNKEFLQNHVEVEAHKNGEQNSNELRLKLIQTLVNEFLELQEALDIVIRISTRVHILVLGGLRGILSLTEQGFVIFHECP